MNNKPATLAVILLLLFISGSTWLVFEYVSAEKQRDLSDWKARLNIMAESQQRSVESWFEDRVDVLQAFADNPLLQISVSQSASAADESETLRGQWQHLKNLLNATAKNADVFTPVSAINNNIKNDINDGIAVFDREKMMLATRYFPVRDVRVEQMYSQVMKQHRVVISDIYDSGIAETGKRLPRFIIAVPVSPVQALSMDEVSGVVIAVINPEDNLYTILLKDWLSTHTEETILVSLTTESVNYLSPVKQGFELFLKRPRINSAAGAAAAGDGGSVIQLDYRQKEVLATARIISGTSMLLVQKIDVDEALLESAEHQKFILTIFLLAVFVIAIGFIAIWRHATSLRLQKATSRLRARAELLNAIGNSINDLIFLLDHKNKLVFINDALTRSFSVDDTDVRGKSLNHIFTNEVSGRLLAVMPSADQANVRNKEMRLQIDDIRHDYHVSVIALKHADYKQSYLYVMHDITELKDAQGKHNRLMEAIISTLAQLIDKHDPHCAHHSERTREVAVAIAKAMDLPQKRIDSLAMASLLANIGKLHIPAEVLTNIEPLTEEEELLLRENINYSVDILRDLEFYGPVIKIVQQKNECLDGSGYPAGISGDQIYQESRILSVANAFVAMTSSRAYRSGKPVKDVLDVLISEADSRYDRNVIAALFHVAENHSDWASWQQVM